VSFFVLCGSTGAHVFFFSSKIPSTPPGWLVNTVLVTVNTVLRIENRATVIYEWYGPPTTGDGRRLKAVVRTDDAAITPAA
jgi:hypothetical protein